MELSENLKDIIMRAGAKADISIIVSDGRQVIYYIGEIEKCYDYMHSGVSKQFKERINSILNETLEIYENDLNFKIFEALEDVYESQAIYKIESKKISIIFLKEKGYFTDNDKLIIDSVTFLANRIN